MFVRIECPKCGYVMSVFDGATLSSNRTIRRAYEHALKSPVLCAGCGRWVQRPKVERGSEDELPQNNGGSASRALG